MSGSTKHPAGENFPRGKLNKDDEGQLAIKVGSDANTVVIDFGKSVAWIGLDADTAAALALSILRHARSVGLTQPITLEF